MTGAIVYPKILPAPRSPDVKQDHEKRHRLTQAQNLTDGIGFDEIFGHGVVHRHHARCQNHDADALRRVGAKNHRLTSGVQWGIYTGRPGKTDIDISKPVMRYIKSLMVVLEKGLYQIIEQLDGQYADQVKLKTQHGFAVGMFLKVGREVARAGAV